MPYIGDCTSAIGKPIHKEALGLLVDQGRTFELQAIETSTGLRGAVLKTLGNHRIPHFSGWHNFHGVEGLELGDGWTISAFARSRQGCKSITRKQVSSPEAALTISANLEFGENGHAHLYRLEALEIRQGIKTGLATNLGTALTKKQSVSGFSANLTLEDKNTIPYLPNLVLLRRTEEIDYFANQVDRYLNHSLTVSWKMGGHLDKATLSIGHDFPRGTLLQAYGFEQASRLFDNLFLGKRLRTVATTKEILRAAAGQPRSILEMLQFDR